MVLAVAVGATACTCESPSTARQGRSKSERGMRTALNGMQGSASSMGECIPFSTIVPRRKSPKARHLGESNPSSLEHCPRLGHQSGPEMPSTLSSNVLPPVTPSWSTLSLSTLSSSMRLSRTPLSSMLLSSTPLHGRFLLAMPLSSVLPSASPLLSTASCDGVVGLRIELCGSVESQKWCAGGKQGAAEVV